MASPLELKDDRKYTREHEWALRSGPSELLVGVTSFAVDQLGDITLVNIDAKAGDLVKANAPFGTIESVKTLSDLFAPVAGKVVRVNAALVDHPELVNEDCWGKGWMIAIEPSAPGEDASLLDVAAYRKHVESAAH